MKQRESSKGRAEMDRGGIAAGCCSAVRIVCGESVDGEGDVSALVDARQHSIVRVSSGVARLEAADREVDAEAGDLLLIGSEDCRGKWRLVVRDGRVAVLGFLAEAMMRGSTAEESMEYLACFEGPGKQTPGKMAGTSDGVAEILEAMQRMEKELEANGAGANLKIRTLMKLVLVLIRQHWSEGLNRNVPGSRDYARLEPLLDYLTQHYMHPISVEQAAQVLNMSKSHFMRCFRRVTGSAFVPYLNQLRIAKAKALMFEGRLSIAEVGECVGLMDQSYFSKVFRKVSGLGPREFREQVRKAAGGAAAK